MEKIKKHKFYSRKRRAAMAASGITIDPVEIFERDNWICSICSKLIERHRRCPDPLAGTLDHIKSLSNWVDALELWHTPENLQASHKVCNERKGNSQ